MPNSPVRVKSEMELLRAKNIKVRDEFFMSLIKDDPDFVEVMEMLRKPPDKREISKPKIRKNKSSDPTFSCRISIPVERRRSARLQNKEVDYSVDTETETETKKRKRSDDFTDLEEVIYEPKKPRKSGGGGKRSVHHIIPVEEIEDWMIEAIVTSSTKKIHSPNGTCCHQCRQKTLDQKTCCRNVNCVGLRGQNCGFCLLVRYGEDAAKALRDPNWHCPVCRGICNCSICRTKAGKRPTGVMYPMAYQAGQKSVKDFLDSLRGEGDFPDKENQSNDQESLEELDDLLGFSSDGNATYINGVQHEFGPQLDLEKMLDFCREEEGKLLLFKDNFDELPNLLGFFKDSNICLLENNIKCELEPPLFPQMDIQDFDEDKKDVLQSEEFELKTEMNSDLLQETQSTAASG